MCASRYNRSWIIRNTVSEALALMLFQQFIGEQRFGLPDGLAEICADPDSYTSSTETQYHELGCKYEAFRQSVKEGKFGKTPQFWMIYLELIRNQQMIHLVVQKKANLIVDCIRGKKKWYHYILLQIKLTKLDTVHNMLK